MTSTRIATLLVAGLLLTACGGADDAGSPATTAPAAATTEMADEDMADEDMADMNMGDPEAAPADEVADAEVASGVFMLLDTAPEGYGDVEGTADLARHDGGTTVTIELTGLEPDVMYVSHVHEGSCAEGGGDHYQFDPDGGEMPPNEIHLNFTSDADGTGFMTAENAQTAGEDAQSVVVHPADLQDNRVACAQLQ